MLDEPTKRWCRIASNAVPVQSLPGSDPASRRRRSAPGAVVSGRLHVVHNDGSEEEARPGDAYVIEPGHDAWVVGDEPVVALEFESAETFARA